VFSLAFPHSSGDACPQTWEVLRDSANQDILFGVLEEIFGGVEQKRKEEGLVLFRSSYSFLLLLLESLHCPKSRKRGYQTFRERKRKIFSSSGRKDDEFQREKERKE